METLLDSWSKTEYTLLIGLEKRYTSLQFVDFFYNKLESEYSNITRNIYGLVAQFRIATLKIYTQKASQNLLLELKIISDKLKDYSIYPLLFAEYNTLSSIIDTIIAVKELDYLTAVTSIHKTRIYYKKWTSYYQEPLPIHVFIKEIMDLQFEKIKFIFSTSESSLLSGKLDKIIKKQVQLLLFGITENGLYKYRCMPGVNVQTGLGRFPVLHTKLQGHEVILPEIISIFYYWKRLNCSCKKLNTKNVDIRNQYLPWGTIIAFADVHKVYEMLLLDSRVFVVLISGLKDYSALVNEQILSNILDMWTNKLCI